MQFSTEVGPNQSREITGETIKRRLCFENSSRLDLQEDPSDDYIKILSSSPNDEFKKEQVKQALLFCIADFYKDLSQDANLSQSSWQSVGSDRLLKILTYSINELATEASAIVQNKTLGSSEIAKTFYATIIKELANIGNYFSTAFYQEMFTFLGPENGCAIFYCLLHADSSALTVNYIKELLVNDQAKAALARALILTPDLLKGRFRAESAEEFIYSLVFVEPQQREFFNSRARGMLNLNRRII